MRFSDNGYYIEKYIKCDNCGVLLYDQDLETDSVEGADLFCSDWCKEWAALRAAGVEEPKLPLPKKGDQKSA